MKRGVQAVLCLLFVFFLSILAHAQSLDLRILHVNDFHGFAEAYKPLGSRELLGGVAHLAGKVGSLRQEKPTLLLAAGDMIQGNNWANMSQGESVIELMNAMEFDAMVLGNHEFDFGQAVLKKKSFRIRFSCPRRQRGGSGSPQAFYHKGNGWGKSGDRRDRDRGDSGRHPPP